MWYVLAFLALLAVCSAILLWILCRTVRKIT